MNIPSVKRLLLFFVMLLTACALKPPVQEMSDARSAIKMAHALPDRQAADSQHKSAVYLKRAESALDEAAVAIRAKHFEAARSKALEAKRNAQAAARIKQQKKSQQKQLKQQ